MSNNLGEGVLGAAEQELGKDIYKQIKLVFNYLCCFSNNVESMKTTALHLENERLRVQTEITGNIVGKPAVRVETWLDSTKKIQDKKREIDDKLPKPESGCWPKFKSPFSLGQKVVLTTEAMEKLRRQGSGFNTDNIFLSDPAPALIPFQPEDALELKSRNQIEEDIVRLLTQGEVNNVGIHGMGGAGKTTLANSIMRRLQSEGSFPAVVEVVVSQYEGEVRQNGVVVRRTSANLLEIQQVIMDSLDFKDDEKKVKDVKLRKRLISEKLKSPSQKVMILLDDIWKAFSLEELGIPRKGGCATLITSRDKDVMRMMCGIGNNVFEIGTLLPEEAQSLFQKIARIDLDDPKLRPVAKEVLQECGGLPLAVVTIAGALEDKEKDVWDRALRQLKSSKPIDGTVYEGLHERLMLSYDLLDDEDAKLIFLLCSLYPEDYIILINDLELYVMGIKMNEVDSLVEARDRVWKAVEKLKSCYLLLEGQTKTEVYMHDVLRDVAVSITVKEGLVDANLKSKGRQDKKCKWIQLYPTSHYEPLDHHLIGINFPNLCLLLIHPYLHPNLELSDISFLKGMQGLNALSFKNARFGSQLEEIKWPNSLITLQLECCYDLKTLFSVGDLSNLKILDCNGCKVTELPVQISQLKYLKLLNLSGCRRLKSIARGIIKELTELEELKMMRSFSKWESSKVNDKEGMNVALNELEALRKLTRLEIEIDDTSLAHEKIDISPNLVSYRIGFQSKPWFKNFNYDNAIRMCGLPNGINADGSWIHKLLATTAVEEFNLDGDGSINLGNPSRNHRTLKGLKIRNCKMLKGLVDSSATPIAGLLVWEFFPMLEHLELVDLPELTQVCDGQQIAFNNVRTVIIQNCCKLQNFMSWKKAMDVFKELETLEIKECKAMEKVFIRNESSDEGGKTTIMRFPKLKKLILSKLPSLSTLWEGSESCIEFPSLDVFEIKYCEQMKSLVCSGMDSENEHTCDRMGSLVCGGMESKSDHTCGTDEKGTNNNKVKLGGLKTLSLNAINVRSMCCLQIPESFFKTLEWLNICNCHNIRSLFSQSNVENLVNLKELRIEDCDAMEEIFKIEKTENAEKTTGRITFSNLRALVLNRLPGLISLGKRIEIIEFPMLETLTIGHCPKLQKIVDPTESIEEIGEGCNNDDKPILFTCDKKVKLDVLGGLTLSSINMSSLCCPQIRESFFETLEWLNICNFYNIRSLFSLSDVENLVNLKELCIEDCDVMEEIFRMENNDEKKRGRITFSKLRKLELKGLLSLTSLGKGIEIIEFPMLEELQIKYCPKLQKIVDPTECIEESGEGCKNDDKRIPFLSDEKVHFNKLRYIHIVGCHAISSLFTFLASEDLTTTTEIQGSGQIRKVITGESEIHGSTILFPSLKRIIMDNMLTLEVLSDWKCPLELPMLEQIDIKKCPHFKFLTSGSLSTPNLKKVYIDSTRVEEEMEDLNRFLCESLMPTREVWKLIARVFEPSQLEMLVLHRHPLSLPPANAVRLVYRTHSYDKSLLVVTSNADPMLWSWTYEQSSSSIVPKLWQLTDGGPLSDDGSVDCIDDYSGNAKSILDDSIKWIALSRVADIVASYVSSETAALNHLDIANDTGISLASPSAAETYLAFHPSDEDIIAIGMDDSTIQIYNRRAAKVQTTLKSGHQKRITGLAFSQIYKILVSSGADAQLCVWDIDGWNKKKSRPLQAPPNYPSPLDGETRVQFRKNEFHLLVVHESHVAVYDEQLEHLHSWCPRDSLSSPVSCAAYSCDGRMIYIGFHDGAVGILDSENLSLLCRIAPSAYISSVIGSDVNAFPKVLDIAANPIDSNKFALASSDSTIYVIKPSRDTWEKSREEAKCRALELYNV